AIGCALGTPDENVIRGTLAELGRLEVSALSVLAVLPAPRRPGLPLGLSDAEYAHQNNMITHPEVRAVVLSKLRPVPGVMWDLGAGSGSVGIEAAGLAKGLQVFAVEQNGGRAEDIRVNAERHGVKIHLTEGKIAEVMPALPDPDRIFFGGGSSELEAAFAKLKPGGILVATAVLVDTVAHLAAALREFRTELLTMNVSRAERTAAGEFLRAENPITIAVYKKE
ncbi:MAG: precorrin-6Y C5,15-methyltransferase (decarboxylating) subunit CbiT, partial [bacterium]|nr:precorrin-6Y C5,15-methyltransferase (decarboxylating) subunit CbiT [bacterium]